MKTIRLLVCFLLAGLVMLPVHARKKGVKTAIPSEYEVQLTGVGQDGTKLLKVWYTAKKAETAVAGAKKAAVAACLFRGLAGNGKVNAAETPPLCKATAEDVYADFFESFFADGGTYLRFVNLVTDGMPSGQDRLKMKDGYKVGVCIQVTFDLLREYMQEKGIIKRMDDGF